MAAIYTKTKKDFSFFGVFTENFIERERKK